MASSVSLLAWCSIPSASCSAVALDTPIRSRNATTVSWRVRLAAAISKPSRGEADGAVGLSGDQPGIRKSVQDPRDRHMADLHPLRKVLDAASARRHFDVGDRLDIVLGGLVGMISAGLGEGIWSVRHERPFTGSGTPPGSGRTNP